MKTKLLAFLLITLVALPLIAAPPEKRDIRHPMAAVTDNDTWIDANNILMFVTNHGNFCRDLSGVFGQDAGTFFPYVDTASISDGSLNDYVLYASGLWVGAKVDGETRVIIAEYSDEYVPGPMANGTFQEDRPEFKVYKLYRDSLADNPNDDYNNWPVDQGAPVNDDGTPEMLGDQMLWAVYNDADPDGHDNDAGNTDPLGLEVRHTTFAFDRQDPLGNIIFVRLRVYNKGDNTLDSCYLSLWCDPDLGDHTDDLVGCDTLLNLGFVYNGDAYDANHYFDRPPSAGYDFFQGPLDYTGLDADTAKMWDTIWPGYRNLGLYSFNKYINGTDPNDYTETYNYMRGLLANGDPYEYNGEPLLFAHSGDPVKQLGDRDTDPADRRWMQTTGPITFAPGDSTEILVGIIVAQSTNWKTSISLMKYYDRFAQLAYNLDFDLPRAPAPPSVVVSERDGAIALSWDDTSEVDPGDYKFEGYTVFQGLTAQGPWTQIANFDSTSMPDVIFDAVFDPESGQQEDRAVRLGENMGIQYQIYIDEDYIRGGPLRNVYQYYYRVDAYSLNPDTLDPKLFLEGLKTLNSSTQIAVRPQKPASDRIFSHVSGDTLPTVQAAGGSDGVVLPIVVDHEGLTGHDYEVTFTVDEGVTYWDLRDVTTGLLLLDDETNLSGDDFYPIVDGFLLKVSGPPDPGVLAGNDGWSVPSGARRFTWANADFGFEGFNGAIGWGGPGDVFGGQDPYPFTDLPEVEIRLATVALDGTFDENDENVSYAYRYGRGFTGDPARPEFAEHMINTTDGGYRFQDFAKTCPLSVWNVDVDPPQRLVVGYLENNGPLATLDGKYWPPESDSLGAWGTDMSDGNGPREWLWIYGADYSETPNAAYQGDAIGDPMPVMYWLTVARRGSDVPFSPGGTGEDRFRIIPAKVIQADDRYTFNTSVLTASSEESILEAIRVVPNPFYLYGPYDPTPGNYQIKFQNLPTECTITIYNIAGEFIRRIEKNDPTTSIATWDVYTDNNLPVASGIYIWVVDAPGVGTKIGKFAVFTETELINTY